MSRRISLSSQISEVEHYAALRRQSAFGDRAAVHEMHKEQIVAVVRTLTWLQEHEVEIRAFLELPPEVRAAVVSHGPIVAELAVEIQKREAIAKAGGPKR